MRRRGGASCAASDDGRGEQRGGRRSAGRSVQRGDSWWRGGARSVARGRCWVGASSQSVPGREAGGRMASQTLADVGAQPGGGRRVQHGLGWRQLTGGERIKHGPTRRGWGSG
jgi:hypothetical protein